MTHLGFAKGFGYDAYQEFETFLSIEPVPMANALAVLANVALHGSGVARALGDTYSPPDLYCRQGLGKLRVAVFYRAIDKAAGAPGADVTVLLVARDQGNFPALERIALSR